MKNDYEIRGEITAIFGTRNGEIVECIIDTEDLPVVQEFRNTWRYSNGYFMGSTYKTTNGIKKETAIMMHRLISKCPDGFNVDHINRDRSNNTKANLRIVTHKENGQNRTKNSNSKSGIRGVSWLKNDRKWRVMVQVDKKNMLIGDYLTLEEAERASVEARARYMPYSEEAHTGIEDTGFIEKSRKEYSTLGNRNGKSGFRGVVWCKKRKKWKVYINIRKKRYTSSHNTFEEAKQAAIKLFEYRDTLI